MKKKTLIATTSGVRGIVGAGLDVEVATAYAAAFGSMLKGGKIVIGRDSRPSGKIFNQSVTAALVSVGCNVVELGIVPTPTVEIAVKKLRAVGGICITASHNPSQWNALKFFNDHGEFITPAQFNKLQTILAGKNFAFKKYSAASFIFVSFKQQYAVFEYAFILRKCFFALSYFPFLSNFSPFLR